MTIFLEPCQKTFDVKEIKNMPFYTALDVRVFNIKLFHMDPLNCILIK